MSAQPGATGSGLQASYVDDIPVSHNFNAESRIGKVENNDVFNFAVGNEALNGGGLFGINYNKIALYAIGGFVILYIIKAIK